MSYDFKSFNNKNEMIYICSLLKKLDAYKLNTFDDRFRNQKLQYILQKLNLSPKLDFSLYIKGPYSSDLTKIIYYVKENYDSEVNNIKFVTNELNEKFNNFYFIKKINNRSLELLTTYMLLRDDLKLSDAESRLKLKELKNNNSKELDEIINYYFKIKSGIYDEK